MISLIHTSIRLLSMGLGLYALFYLWNYPLQFVVVFVIAFIGIVHPQKLEDEDV